MPSTPTIPEDHLTFVKASCHCGLNSLRAGFLTESLPISNDLCHCSTCRHTSGQMAVYHVNVSSILCADTDEPFHVNGAHEDGDLIPYKTSENATRYFCSVCSSHLLFHYLGKPGKDGAMEGEYWCVAAGALEQTEGIVQVGYHIWVEDTLDGGLSEHLRSIDGVQLPRFSQGPKSARLPLAWKHPSIALNNDEELHFSCHCKSVQFKITRPDASSYEPHAPFPDLLCPHDTTRLAKIRNARDVKWWLRPRDTILPDKYLAGHCACEFCRLTSGFELQSWAFVPLNNIVDNHNHHIRLQPPPPDYAAEYQKTMDHLHISTPCRTPSPSPSPLPRLDGLKQYIAGPGRYREFCGRCGATVFAWRMSQPDLIWVAVGLVDECQNGARAEAWFDWCLSRVGSMEQAHSKTAEALAEGLMEVEEEVGMDNMSVRSESPLPMPSLLLAFQDDTGATSEKDIADVQVSEAREIAASA